MTTLLEWFDTLQLSAETTIQPGTVVVSSASVVCQQDGARVQLTAPDSRYCGLDISGLDKATDPLKIQPGAGNGANAAFHDTTVQRAKPGTAAIRVNGQQNTPWFDTVVRNNDGADGLVLDGGCKNTALYWAHLSSCRYGLVVDTSSGSQRTSKVKWLGGLSENCLASVLLRDCEDILFDGVTFNAPPGGGPAAVVCETSSARTGQPVGPARLAFRACIFKGWTVALSAIKPVEVRDLGGNTGLTTSGPATLLRASDAGW